MTAKEIGRAAGKLFQNAIPPNWAIRSQEDQEDYGVDYELEKTDEHDHATGYIFKVQQKGAENLPPNADGKTISFGDLKTTKLGYYLNQLRFPVILAVVDLATKSIYWTTLQGNREIREAYDQAVADRQKTVTVHLPIANRLPDTFNRLLQSVDRTNDWLAVQALKKALSPDLLRAALQDTRIDDTAAALSLHHDLFRCQQIEQQLEKENYEEALQTAENIFISPSESLRIRFAAALNLLRITQSGAAAVPNGQSDLDYRLSVTSRLVSLMSARNSERRLRLYALFLARSARLRWLVEQDFSLHMSRRAQEKTGDDFTKAFTDAIRAPAAPAIIREIKHIQRYLAWMLRRHNPEFFAPAWTQLVRDLAPFHQRLWNDGLQDAAKDSVAWLDAVGQITIDISGRMKNWRDVATCALQGVSLALPIDDTKAIDARFEAAEKSSDRFQTKVPKRKLWT